MKIITATEKEKYTFKKRLKLFKGILAKNTNQFCENSTLHGLKYLTNKELYPRERAFFGLAFTTVVLLAGYFILNVWAKWSTTPVILGTNPYPSYITKEPFPAVTICNLNVAYKSKAEQFSIYSTEYAMLQMLCKRDVNVTVADSITDWSHLNSFMTEIAQPCSSMIISCRFGAVKYNCSELFIPVMTDEGLCCAFNKLHPAFVFNLDEQNTITQDKPMGDFVPVAWSTESGYQTDLPKKYYPRPAVGVGETLGLSITLDVESDEYYCSSSNSVGFKMLLHNPMENPSLREVGLLLAPGTETKILIIAEKYESEQKLRSIHRRYRQCLFQDEANLMIFSFYTQSNCELECLTKLLLKYCGCISFFMPRLYGNETICSIYQSTCVERMRIASMLSEYNATSCEEHCLPSCYDINYYPYFFSAPLKHDGFQIVNQVVKNMSSSYAEQNIAVLHMYHREHSYRSFKQSEFFGGTDVLSSIGGLIGLFFGFSFISFAEFIFFAIIRPFRATRQIKVPSKNFLISENSQTSWKKPIRKRCRNERIAGEEKMFIGRNPYTYFKNEELLESGDLLKKKWLSNKYFIAGVNNRFQNNTVFDN